MVFAEKAKLNFQYLAFLLLMTLFITVYCLKYDFMQKLVDMSTSKKHQTIHSGDSNQRCNLFSGKWIRDNISYPMYKGGNCSFLEAHFACEKYGRKELKYQNWRWQPHHCDLPRFNGTAFLEKLRGKKLTFVGDSVNRNQWMSMLCLIESSTPAMLSKSVIKTDNFLFIEAKEYNATIGFYWSPFLVESNSDDPDAHRIKDRIVRIKSIEKHARHWTDSDILIFNSFVWWLEPTITMLWGPFGSPNATYKTVDTRLRPYEMALGTWSDWLEFNINRTKTKMFFMSLAPTHFYGENWDAKEHCYGKTEPIEKEGYWGSATYPEMMTTAESAIEKLEKRGLKIEYINITHLSDYRRDAHPSIYREFYQTVSEDQLREDPKRYSDCVHWCLPGVPDVWNQMIYAYIMNGLSAIMNP